MAPHGMCIGARFVWDLQRSFMSLAHPQHEKKLLYIPKLLSLYIAFPSFGCFFGVYCNIANILLVWICLDVIFVQRDLRGRRAKA